MQGRKQLVYDITNGKVKGVLVTHIVKHAKANHLFAIEYKKRLYVGPLYRPQRESKPQSA